MKENSLLHKTMIDIIPLQKQKKSWKNLETIGTKCLTVITFREDGMDGEVKKEIHFLLHYLKGKCTGIIGDFYIVSRIFLYITTFHNMHV